MAIQSMTWDGQCDFSYVLKLRLTNRTCLDFQFMRSALSFVEENDVASSKLLVNGGWESWRPVTKEANSVRRLRGGVP